MFGNLSFMRKWNVPFVVSAPHSLPRGIQVWIWCNARSPTLASPHRCWHQRTPACCHTMIYPIVQPLALLAGQCLSVLPGLLL
jgi:hypothetical protein